LYIIFFYNNNNKSKSSINLINGVCKHPVVELIDTHKIKDLSRSLLGVAMESPVPSKHISQHSLTSGAPEEMFSPTSAAAWALSTMHHFCAATSPHSKTTRPKVNALTGTRLFNGTVIDGTTKVDTHGSCLPISQAPVGSTKSSATGTITWGNLQVHPVLSVRPC
jgi:hypothetical protein